MTEFWFLMFWLMLTILIGSVIGIVLKNTIGKKEQKRKSLVGIDFHDRSKIL